MVRLAHSGTANGQLIASVVDFDGGGGFGAIYRSSDNGATFTQIGGVHDPAAKAGLCCNTLFELPRQVGAMPAGTLLWSASMGQDAANRRMWLPIWKSADHGVTWSYLSTCAAAPNTGGVWEPELAVTTAGDLVCHWSDETNQGAHSQMLLERFSRDGVSWGTVYPTVTPPQRGLRPGMANVRQTVDGRFFMSYEVCGFGNVPYDCATFYRTSADGGNWGDPNGAGPRLYGASGQYFTHTPTLSVFNNRIYLSGQQLRESNGAISGGSGRTILMSTGGPWNPLAAPVAVPNPPNAPCPNYNPTHQVTADGSRLVEIATDLVNNICQPFYASGSPG